MIMSELLPFCLSIFSLNNTLASNENLPMELNDIHSNADAGRKTYRRRWKLEEGGTPQSEELWWIHSVLNGVLLLLVNPAHVDNLSEGKDNNKKACYFMPLCKIY